MANTRNPTYYVSFNNDPLKLSSGSFATPLQIMNELKLASTDIKSISNRNAYFVNKYTLHNRNDNIDNSKRPTEIRRNFILNKQNQIIIINRCYYKNIDDSNSNQIISLTADSYNIVDNAANNQSHTQLIDSIEKEFEVPENFIPLYSNNKINNQIEGIIFEHIRQKWPKALDNYYKYSKPDNMIFDETSEYRLNKDIYYDDKIKNILEKNDLLSEKLKILLSKQTPKNIPVNDIIKTKINLLITDDNTIKLIYRYYCKNKNNEKIFIEASLYSNNQELNLIKKTSLSIATILDNDNLSNNDYDKFELAINNAFREEDYLQLEVDPSNPEENNFNNLSKKDSEDEALVVIHSPQSSNTQNESNEAVLLSRDFVIGIAIGIAAFVLVGIFTGGFGFIGLGFLTSAAIAGLFIPVVAGVFTGLGAGARLLFNKIFNKDENSEEKKEKEEDSTSDNQYYILSSSDPDDGLLVYTMHESDDKSHDSHIDSEHSQEDLSRKPPTKAPLSKKIFPYLKENNMSSDEDSDYNDYSQPSSNSNTPSWFSIFHFFENDDISEFLDEKMKNFLMDFHLRHIIKNPKLENISEFPPELNDAEKEKFLMVINSNEIYECLANNTQLESESKILLRTWKNIVDQHGEFNNNPILKYINEFNDNYKKHL